MPPPGAIVVGAHVNGLGVIRALGSRGVPIASISTRPFDIAQHSRFVVDRERFVGLHERPDALADWLEQQARRWPGWAIFPTNDDAVTAIARAHERLSRSYRLTVQPWAVTSRLANKDAMHALAVDTGLDVPRCFGPATRATAADPALRFPVVVKPIQHDRLISLFGVKLFLAHDRPALATAIDRLDEAGLAGLIYEFVPGPDRQVYVYCVYMDGEGRASPGVTIRKLRQLPPLVGGARAAEVVPEIAALRSATIALLRHAGFRGMAFAEFKQDPATGRFRFIEVNGRAVLFNSLPARAGLDLVWMTWTDFVLGQPPITGQPTWRGAWIHLAADLAGTIRHRQSERLTAREFLAPYRQSNTFAVWSASDPAPFFAEAMLAVRRRLPPPRTPRQAAMTPGGPVSRPV